jgi:hypothetical protein
MFRVSKEEISSSIYPIQLDSVAVEKTPKDLLLQVVRVGEALLKRIEGASTAFADIGAPAMWRGDNPSQLLGNCTKVLKRCVKVITECLL